MTINSPVGWLTSWAESWWSAAAGYLKAISTPLFSVRFFPITSLTQSSSLLTPIYYNLRSFGQAGYFEASIVSTIVERLVKDKGRAHKAKRGAMLANLMRCPFASSPPSPPVVEVFLRDSSWAVHQLPGIHRLWTIQLPEPHRFPVVKALHVTQYGGEEIRLRQWRTTVTVDASSKTCRYLQL